MISLAGHGFLLYLVKTLFCLFVCSEYGAPDEGELKEQKPFALKNQLLSTNLPSSHRYRPLKPSPYERLCFHFSLNVRLSGGFGEEAHREEAAR